MRDGGAGGGERWGGGRRGWVSAGALALLLGAVASCTGGGEPPGGGEDAGPALVDVNPTPLPHLTYKGGSMLDHVKVVPVYWGPNVDSEARARLPDLYRALVTSAYRDFLGEYDTANDAGRGVHLGPGTVTEPVTLTPLNQSSVLGWLDVAAELRARASVDLPPPDAQTLYMVHFPPEVSLAWGKNHDCTRWSGNFWAWHFWATDPDGVSLPLAFAMMPDFRQGVCGAEGAYSAQNPPFETLSGNVSHELFEAITDPDVNLGWADRQPADALNYHSEITDICGMGSSTIPGDGGPFLVQRQWSNRHQACIVSRDDVYPVTFAPEVATATPGSVATVTLATGLPAQVPDQSVQVLLGGVPEGTGIALAARPALVRLGGSTQLELQVDATVAPAIYHLQLQLHGRRASLFRELKLVVTGPPAAGPPPPASGLPHASYVGGPVLAAPKVFAVFWGPSVDPEVQALVGPFLTAALDSPLTDWLSEYSPPAHAVDGQPGTGQTIGRGHLAGAITLSPLSSATSIIDHDVALELAAQIRRGALPPPDADTVYLVYLPPGVTFSSLGVREADAGAPPAWLCGVHRSFEQDGHLIVYAIVPDEARRCGGPGSALENFTIQTWKVLHGAILDPHTTVADTCPLIGSPHGWVDLDPHYERWGKVGGMYWSGLSDLTRVCDADDPMGTLTTSDGGTYAVHKAWSNLASACIVDRASAFSASLQPAAAVATAGHATATLSLSTLGVGPAQPVRLDTTALPAGVTVAFSPERPSTGQSTTMTVTAGPGAPRWFEFNVRAHGANAVAYARGSVSVR